MIEVQGLTKRFGPHTAIEDISFGVESGEIVGLLGPNGAGKTTTMRILTGYFPATRGRALIDGYDVARFPLDVKRRVGYLPESVPLYAEMSVQGYLSYVARVKGLSKDARRAEMTRVLEHCGLAEMRRRIIRHLSKGYRQRVGLAQALLGNPPVLILDEPTVGLDPKQIIGIREMIRDLAQEHTVLISTHILPEVAMICNRVLILHDGRIAAEKTLGDADSGASLEEVFLAAISGEAEVSA